MNYTVSHSQPESVKAACLIVGIYTKLKFSNAAKRLDEASNGQFSKLLKLSGMDGETGQTLLLLDIQNIVAQRVLVIGCGDANLISAREYRKINAQAASALLNNKITEAVTFLTEIQVAEQSSDWHIQQAIMTTQGQFYSFDQFKTENSKKKTALQKLNLFVHEPSLAKSGSKSAKLAHAIANGIQKTRDFGNLPSNICTPSYLAKEARNLTKINSKVKVQVLSEADLKKLGMGAFLSVSRGTEEPAKMIVIEFLNSKQQKKPTVLVGKGITFDSGGISLKPSANMDEMKYDMCGAASVLGTLTACAELDLAINLVGIIVTTENMPSGHASKPGDIVTSMSGQTIEILNTDAEGRLILCDALTYAERFNPAVVIDIATLTGACVVALGRNPSGLYTNHQPLADELIKAGEISGDRVWQMPLWEEYQEQLKSNFADMANIGGPEAGSVTAACFLSRFTKKYHWAHLDIAGTAWKSGAQKGATGRPVGLLMQYLLDRHAS